ncbi:N-acetylmuramoyl-L-alanine amidase [bacterium BMS3Bbin03]|nr:N-acetylmuramoyl-L-alanine amidase [bacterium BMS3Bbin03]
MPSLDHLLAVILKLLVPATLLERVLEFIAITFETTGIFRGNISLAYRLSGLTREKLPQLEKKLKLQKRLILQAIGIVLGVLLCWKGNLRIFEMMGFAQGQIAPWIDILLSGILISGGSQPIHDLINFLQKARENARAQALPPSKESDMPLQPGANVNEFKKMTYAGGIYPNRSGHGLRKKNPSYIIVHHSATKNTVTFEEIVAIEKERKLDPSYHCVVTFDGQLHPYCRWDSVGYHIKRSNKISNGNSLGICFVGNFSTDPETPENNSTGKFGPDTPSEAQIINAAKMIALWSKIYRIPEKNIVRHRDVKKGHTDCPGNNFPFDKLLTGVKKEISILENMPRFTAFVEEFRKKDYVMIPVSGEEAA